MTAIEDFHIQFDSKWTVYAPGDRVTGSVFIRLNKEILVDAVLANFRGLARVLWVEQEVRNGRFLNVPYSSENIYFNEQAKLWNYDEGRINENGKEKEKVAKEKEALLDPIDVEIDHLLGRTRQLGPSRSTVAAGISTGGSLSSGDHTFPFAFQLPVDLPTSFDASHSDGYIRYSVQICLMSQNATRIKHSRKAYFTIVKPEDLNLLSLTPTGITLVTTPLQQPVRKRSEILCKNGLFGSKKQQQQNRTTTPTAAAAGTNATANGAGSCYIQLTGGLPKGGYVPGEPIFVDIEVENRTAKPLTLFKMHLMQKVTCHVDKPEPKSRTSTHPVCAVSKLETVRGSFTSTTTTINLGPLYIPAVVPTFEVEDCLVASYFILVEAYRRQERPKLSVRLPIRIGTVPLRGNDQSGTVSGGGMTNGDEPPNYEDLINNIPPPTYEESQAGLTKSGDEKQEKAVEEYVPRYLLYKYN